jgi:hypothetical protein
METGPVSIFVPLKKKVYSTFPLGTILAPGPLGTIYEHPAVQYLCLHYMTTIHRMLSRPETIMKLIRIMQSLGQPIVMDFSTLYTFFLKGGNVLPLLANPHAQIPIHFTGDFDATLLLNPSMDPLLFKIMREALIVEIVHTLQQLLPMPPDMDILRKAFVQLGLVMEPIGPLPFDVRTTALTPDDLELDTLLYQSKGFKEIRFPPECPLRCVIQPNLSFGSNTLNFTLIKIVTRTVPPMDLLDISIPSRFYKNIEFEWDIHRTTHFRPNPHVEFLLADSLSTYIAYRIAALTDSRPNKQASRTRRANTVRNTILIPLLRSGHLTQAQVDKFKSIPYNHPSVRNLRTILSDVHA